MRWTCWAALFIVVGSIIAVVLTVALKKKPSAEADVRKAFEAAKEVMRTGDVEKVPTAFEFTSDDDRKALAFSFEIRRQSQSLADAQTRLDLASQAKFSQPWFARAITPAATLPLKNNPKPSEPVITIEGDRATVETTFDADNGKTVSMKTIMVRRNGDWKFLLENLPNPKPESLQHSSQMQANMAEACRITAKEIEAGQYPTMKEAQQGFLDNLGKIDRRDAKARPQLSPKLLVWDLSKSHTLKDVGWPSENTSLFWHPESKGEVYQFTLNLPGLNPITVLTEHPEVSRDVTQKYPLPMKNISLNEPVGHLTFGNKEPMTAEQVKAFADKIGLNDTVKKQLAAWPQDDPKNQIFTFQQALDGGGGIRIDLCNSRKFTGEKDSWDMTIYADWAKKPPGYWDTK